MFNSTLPWTHLKSLLNIVVSYTKEPILFLEKIVFIPSDNQSYQCYECGLIYGTHRDLRQHVRKVHGREIDADRPAGGLPVRTRPYSFTTTMKEEEEIIENEANSKAGQQMAIIQIRNQHNDSQKSSLIVRIEQGSVFSLFTSISSLIRFRFRC